MTSKNVSENKASHEETVTEKVSDIIRGTDEPMEQTHPEAPPFLVFASYPLVLIVGVLLVIVAYWLTRS